MRVTSKGQVTIPLQVRRRLGITTGSEVSFTIDGDSVRLVRTESRDGAEIVRRMRGVGPTTLSTDEIMALTRES